MSDLRPFNPKPWGICRSVSLNPTTGQQQQQHLRTEDGNSNSSSTNECKGELDIDQVVKSLVTGEMTTLPRLSSKIVRVFISSTFSDMVHERNVLMESVYPELKNFCREMYRLEFQMVDLRWGIREEAHDNHTIIDFCLKEIENCRNISIGPNFVILIGQKYGFRPFPPIIDANEFEAIRAELSKNDGLLDSVCDSDSASKAETTKINDLSESFENSLEINPKSASLAAATTIIAPTSSSSDVHLLNSWFRKDTNIIPHEYVLQPISSLIPDFGNEVDRQKHASAQEQWNTIRMRLHEILRRGITLCVDCKKLPENSRNKYFISVTEYEIEQGLLNVTEACDTCLCFVRTVDNLEENRHKPKARLFLDFVDSKSNEIDTEAQNLLNDLLNVKITSALKDERNFEYFKLQWEDLENKDPVDDDNYLKKFCESFREKMQWLINKSAQRINQINLMPKMVEIIQQLEMCKIRSESLRGRDEALKKARVYITSQLPVPSSSSTSTSPCLPSPNKPYVLYGESGSGKTSVSAKVAFEAKTWYYETNQTNPVVIVRFLGTTCYSCSVRLMLGSICFQIAKAYELNVEEIPTDYPGLVFYFHEILKKSTKEKPLILVLDGLDQLASTHRAHGLAWLPFSLPDYVRIIVSTVANKHGIFSILSTQLSDVRKRNFEEIKPLGSKLSFDLIKEWLQLSNIDLTPDQFKIVKEALTNCSLPLYTILVFEQIRQWRSYYSPDQIVIEKSTESIISSLLDRIESSHGQIFVSHSLSYLTASREGLSDVELEDVLSLDDDVLNDVFQHWIPPLRRIPPLLVPRLQIELASYIIQRETNGTMVYYWYHAQFFDVARKRYLSNEVHKTYVHQVLAHYFLGTWGGGNKKAYTCPEKQIKLMSSRRQEELEDRKVPSQPLIFGKDTCFNEEDINLDNKPNFNLRKLCELPFHLLESQMYVDLRHEVLFNYEWLYTKLRALSLHDALSDYSLAIQRFENNEDILLLYSALRMSGSQINENPRSLAFDLIGRLLHYYNDNERHHCSIRRLLQQCDQQSLKHSALLPLKQCFEPPKLSAIFVLEGHNQQISDIVINDETNELISVSKDGYLAFWDLVGGERSRTIDISVVNPGRLTRLFQSSDGKYLIVDSDHTESPILILETKIGQIIHKCGSREATTRRGFISGNLFCRQKSLIDIEKGELIKRIEDFTTNRNYVVCALTPDGTSILLAETNEIKMFDFRESSLIKILQKIDENAVNVLQITDDSRVCYSGCVQSLLFTIFDIDKSSNSFGQHLFQIDCTTYLNASNIPFASSSQIQNLLHEIWEINLCPNDSYLILINICKNSLISFDFKSQTLTVMKVDSNIDEKRSSKMKHNFGFDKSAYNYDGSIVLASYSNYLNVWNAKNGDFLQKITIHSTSDFPYPWCVSQTRNIVATGSTIDTAVRVWDLDRTEKVDLSNFKVYMNPIDCVTCAPANRLVYVKSYYGLNSSSHGYKFFDRFAIDVWNISTGNWKCFIPFFKYGRLIEMKSSYDGRYLALLLNSLSQWYVVILNVIKNEVQCAAGHEVDWQCKEFEFSPDWDFMASYARLDQENEIILWNVEQNKKIVQIHEAKNPVFTLDGQFLLYIDAGINIILYSLKNLAPAKCYSHLFPDKLTCVPVKHYTILVTKYKETSSIISVWDFYGSGRIKCEIPNVSKFGFADVSKNGHLAVDDLLQVFEITTGVLLRQFKRSSNSNSMKDSNEKLSVNDSINPKLVKLTYDGLYCIWFEELTCLIKVGNVGNGLIIAQSNLHETIITMETMDYGYVLFCGRNDGHIITMKLTPQENIEASEMYIPKNETDRRNYILDRDPCPQSLIQQFDRMFQQPSQHINDSDVNVASINVNTQLSNHAELPRLFTFLKLDNAASKLSNSNISVINNSPSVLLFAQQNNNFFPPSNDMRFLLKNKKLAEFTNMSHSSMSLPRRNNNAKPDIRLVTSSSASLDTENSTGSQGSLRSPDNSPHLTTTKKFKSAQELCKLNGNFSKSSLDSLIDKVEKSCNKNKNKVSISEAVEKNEFSPKIKGGNILGRHSLKISKPKIKNKFLSLFSHLKTEKK